MSNAIIVYTSMTGNTEEIAETLKDTLVKKGIDTELVDSQDTNASELSNYDISVVATYTYGQGELPDDIVDFYEELKEIDLSDKKFGIIGSGDKSYDDLYCKAADLFEQVFTTIGAKKAANTLKIEFNEYDDEQIEKFATELLA